MSACYCGSGKPYAVCCGRLHSGAEIAASAEALMRSRYSAYVLKLEDYLLATWHLATRPSELDLTADDTKWLGLEVKKHALQDDCHATVEFVARYRIAGKGHRLHELSRFVCEDGRWYYVDGDMMDGRADRTCRP
ncbi:MAG: YchJ family metal-binding protein [Azonexus sp.]